MNFPKEARYNGGEGNKKGATRMTLLQMRYFLTVCRLQNITHAAAELHVAQSTLSQAMQGLEEETGLNLFLRAGRHIMISQDGQRLAQKLSRLLAQVDAVDDQRSKFAAKDIEALLAHADDLDRLAELEHVKAVKDATGDLAAAVEKQQRTGLAWYSGDDGLFLPFLSVGAVGIISVIAHAAAGPMRDLANAFDRGDIHEAQRISVQLAPLVEAMNGNGFQAVMAKASLKVRGILDSTEMRLPNVGPGEAELVRAEKGMRAAGLL